MYSAVALVLLCFLLATNVYRAGHQSITVDEAFSYHKHIASWKFWMFREYTASNHVLHTLLCKLSIGLFGLSELTLRLPSLLGGLLYFAAIFRISRLLFGQSAWFLLSVSLSCLNPLILDFLSAARGYGLGLALFCWGLFYCLEYLTPSLPLNRSVNQARAIKAGAALGLAVTAQLTYAVPSVALVTVFIAVVIGSAVRAEQHLTWREVLRPPVLLIMAGASITGALLAWPMRNARLSNFYVGETTLKNTVQSLVQASLFYKPTVLDDVPFIRRALFDPFAGLLMLFFCAVVLVVAFGIGRRRKKPAEINLYQKRLLLMLGVMLAWCLLLSTARMVVARPFPSGRTALYWLPLSSCAYLLALRSVENRIVRFVGALAVLIYALQYGLQFNVSYYWVYRLDAGVKRMVALIRERRATEDGREIKVGASWFVADSINFYREMYSANWMEPVTRAGPDCYYDYYVLGLDDLRVARRYDLEELYRDEVSGTVLAKPNDSTLRTLETIYPPPIQRSPPCGIDPTKLGSFARMDDPGARPHVVRDIMDIAPEPWTYERPMLLFRVDKREDVKFVMHFLIPGVVLSQTGPLTLSVWINAKRLGQQIYKNSGKHSFEQSVPIEFFGPYRLTAVEIRTDKHFIAAEDGTKLGFLLVDAGFALQPDRDVCN